MWLDYGTSLVIRTRFGVYCNANLQQLSSRALLTFATSPPPFLLLSSAAQCDSWLCFCYPRLQSPASFVASRLLPCFRLTWEMLLGSSRLPRSLGRAQLGDIPGSHGVVGWAFGSLGNPTCGHVSPKCVAPLKIPPGAADERGRLPRRRAIPCAAGGRGRAPFQFATALGSVSASQTTGGNAAGPAVHWLPAPGARASGRSPCANPRFRARLSASLISRLTIW